MKSKIWNLLGICAGSICIGFVIGLYLSTMRNFWYMIFFVWVNIVTIYFNGNQIINKIKELNHLLGRD